MGTLILDSGTTMSLDEVVGEATLQQIYEDVANEHYTDTYRTRIIVAWGKLKRQGWAILPVLHELTKGSNERLVTAAKDAIKLIDPGAPAITAQDTFSPTVGPSPNSNRFKNTTPVKKEEDRFPVQNGYATVWRKPERKKVVFTEVAVNGDLAEGTRVSGVCAFCDKTANFSKSLREASVSLAGPKKLFCNFCLRNELYRIKHRKHTLLMSFRGIISYYYYCFHIIPKQSSMMLIDLEAYINLHVRVGTQNPLFRYDPESFLWFVDFSKIGNKPRQMPLNYVLETVVDILATFDLYTNVKECSPAALFQKYREAITDFHHHRRRPKDQRILIPTLYATGIPHESGLNKAIPINFIKNFTPKDLVENHKYRQRANGAYYG